ncbi:MAG: hypothetical protein HY329_16545 [Chloroflexi bacterium]|nr:hypothetical protein [Chloroflexota bacterium]
MRALVVGIGNPLRGDDGLGPHVIERLREEGIGCLSREGVDRLRADETACLHQEDVDVGVDLLACHQLTLELAEPASRVGLVIFVDASADTTPGIVTCRRVPPLDAESAGATSHHCSPELILSCAELLYGHRPAGWLVSVGAASFEPGATLSLAARGAVAAVLKRCRGLLRASEVPPLRSVYLS